MQRDSHLVTSSPLYLINHELADIEMSLYNIGKRLDFNRCFRRIYREDQSKLAA